MKQTEPNKPVPSSDHNEFSALPWNIRLLRLANIAVSMAGVYAGMLIILSLLRTTGTQCNDTSGCKSLVPPYAIVVMAAILASAVCTSLLRRIRVGWIASTFAPIIAFACALVCATEVVIVYGEDTLRSPVYLAAAIFMVSFMATVFLLEAIKKTAWAYVVAVIILTSCLALLPLGLSRIASTIWVSHGIDHAQKIVRVYVPTYTISGSELGDVTAPSAGTYTLTYYNGVRFNLFNHANETYFIRADFAGVYNPPQVCELDYTHNPATPDSSTCHKIGHAQDCDVYKIEANPIRPAAYSCKAYGLLFSLSGNNITDADALKVLSSLQLAK